MDKYVAFALFGSVICLASALSVLFLIRSNRKHEAARKRKEEEKLAKYESWITETFL